MVLNGSTVFLLAVVVLTRADTSFNWARVRSAVFLHLTALPDIKDPVNNRGKHPIPLY